MPWREMRRRSAFRLAVLYSALFTGSALVIMGILYWQTAGALAGEVDTTIVAEVEVMAERYRLAGVDGVRDLVEARVGAGRAGDSVYLLVDPSGQRIAGNLVRWPQSETQDDGFIRFRLGNEPDPFQTLRSGRGRIIDFPEGYRLLVGRDMLEIRVFQERILSALGRALAVTVLLALLGAMLVGRGAETRIARINAAIDEIVSGDLARRLPTRDEGDELDELAERVNGMLDRIQELMSGVRQVSDNIAHDLRTPLTRMKRRLEEALAHESAPSPRQVALEAALHEADALLGTFGALLRIARIEAERRREGFDTVDVRALVRDVAELYEPLAEAGGVRLEATTSTSAPVLGDRDLLFQAVANLVDNALKYAPTDTAVHITAHADAGEALIEVEDRGPGIPEAERERVFHRLVRLDDSRSTPGSGLGLSLVAAVARLHDGAVTLEAAEPGTRAILRLPLAPPVALAGAN